jgi:DNA-binding Lrp family transcriptional regulator
VESSILDTVDRRIIHALAVAPRAPLSILAEIVGVSDQTIARRYRRLQGVAGFRIVGRVVGRHVGWVDWFVRLQCVPGTAASIADVLARRADTSWVVLVSGGTEIVCLLQARSHEQRDALLLEDLPGSRRVVHLGAHSVLHEYSPVAWKKITQALSNDEVAALRETLPSEARDTVEFSADDEVLVDHLARDGRATNASLAAAIGWHESTVRRRINELRASGALFFDLDIDNSALGVRMHALLWISVDPGRLDATGRALAEHPEVPFVAAVTGAANLVVSVAFAQTSDLYTYLTDRLGSLPGIGGVETLPMIRVLKRSGPVRQ